MMALACLAVIVSLFTTAPRKPAETGNAWLVVDAGV